MSFIEWSKKLLTGVKESDEQHRKLIELVNELHDAVEQGRGVEEVDEILDRLVKYTKYHFTTEEALMRKHEYPRLSVHVREHESFKAKLRELLCKRKKGEVLLTVESIGFLKEWLIKHITEADKRYGFFLQQKNTETWRDKVRKITHYLYGFRYPK